MFHYEEAKRLNIKIEIEQQYFTFFHSLQSLPLDHDQQYWPNPLLRQQDCISQLLVQHPLLLIQGIFVRFGQFPLERELLLSLSFPQKSRHEFYNLVLTKTMAYLIFYKHLQKERISRPNSLLFQ